VNRLPSDKSVTTVFAKQHIRLVGRQLRKLVIVLSEAEHDAEEDLGVLSTA